MSTATATPHVYTNPRRLREYETIYILQSNVDAEIPLPLRLNKLGDVAMSIEVVVEDFERGKAAAAGKTRFGQ